MKNRKIKKTGKKNGKKTLQKLTLIQNAGNDNISKNYQILKI